MAQRPHGFGNAVGQLLEPGAQNLVVITAPRVERHHGLAGASQPRKLPILPTGRSASAQVIHARGDHTHRAGHQLGRAGPAQAVALHVGHVTMEALRQPGQQTRLGRRKVHTGHADLGKSQLTAPLPDVRDPLSRPESSADRHDGIVESALHLTWRTEDDTRAFAQKLAVLGALRHAFIELHGDLGAGKTTLVRHLLQALGVSGRIKSPTYAVVEPHEVPGLSIWHFDFYRFNDPREWEDAGFRDLFATPGLKLAEWPEKAAGVLPVADLVLRLALQDDESRRVEITSQTALGHTLLKGLAA